MKLYIIYLIIYFFGAARGIYITVDLSIKFFVRWKWSTRNEGAASLSGNLHSGRAAVDRVPHSAVIACILLLVPAMVCCAPQFSADERRMNIITYRETFPGELVFSQNAKESDSVT